MTAHEALALVGLSRVAFRDGENGRVRSLALQAQNLVRDAEPAATVAQDDAFAVAWLREHLDDFPAAQPS